MNNTGDSRFSTGFILGLIIGGGLVFLLATRTGKNLLKIVSEQGFDGFLNLLEEYDIADLEEYEEVEDEENADLREVKPGSNGHAIKKEPAGEEKEASTPKHRFFKRIRR